MKKLLFTIAIVALASCSSNETSTTVTDTLNCEDLTCYDSTDVDSLDKRVESNTDSLSTKVKELTK
jgi:hypothetical protein